MNLRIISGEFGSRKIDAPIGKRTHPMGDRVRTALFNSLGDSLVGVDVLDAFAGSGALGLEALSRGAARATFVERDRLAQNIIAGNIVTLGVQNRAELVRASVSAWMDTRQDGLYDVIFADPPYHDMQLSTVSRLFGLLKPNGLMVLSHTGRGERPNLQYKIVVVDNRSYGSAHLTFFRRDA